MNKTKVQTEEGFYGHLKTNKIMEMEYDGNFFIMDSEQLVSNPFQTMKEEAMDNGKKVSLTEKLTSVKNNVCENHLQMRSSQLQKEITHKLKQIHDTASQLRYEAKIYNINKRKSDLENKKRFEPYRDFSYDESQLNNNIKRLGVVSECHYLERKQQFPLRGRTVNDLNPNATVRQARQVFHKREQQSRQEEAHFRDISTPGTSISSAKSKRSLLWQRRDSKSAPPTSKTSQSLNFEDRSTKLPLLGEKSKVKFSLNDPISRSPDNTLERAKTFHPGMDRRQSKAWTNNEEDDYGDDDDDYIDIDKLRSVLFGDKYTNSVKSGFDTPRTMTSFRSSIPSSSRRSNQLTQEMIKKEQQELQQKIDNFFGNLSTNNSEGGSENEEEPQEEVKPPARLSKANLLLSVYAKSVPTKNAWPEKAETLTNGKAENQKDENDRAKSSCSHRSKSPYSVTIKQEEKKRDLWKYIKTSVQRGEIKRCQTPSKLIIEQMTHLDLTNSDKKHIPLKCANRALRHTPTFKMRQLVQRMQRERTKYEQFEIDQMKTKMQDGTMDGVEITA